MNEQVKVFTELFAIESVLHSTALTRQAPVEGVRQNSRYLVAIGRKTGAAAIKIRKEKQP